MDTDLPGPLDKVVEVAVIEEKLGDDELPSGLYLALEVFQVFAPVRTFDVSLWITRHANPEIVMGFDESNQFAGVAKVALGRVGGQPISGRIPPQGQDVLQAQGVGHIQIAPDHLPTGTDAGEVSHCLNAQVMFHPHSNLKRQVP